jgi:hypothetical protein
MNARQRRLKARRFWRQHMKITVTVEVPVYRSVTRVSWPNDEGGITEVWVPF